MMPRIRVWRRRAALVGLAVTSPVMVLPGQTVSGSLVSPLPQQFTIHDAVTRALDFHPTLAVAVAGESAAEQRWRRERAAWIPTLRADGSVTRYQEPSIVRPLHAFDPTQPPAFAETLVQGAVSLGYRIFDGGSRGARIAGARATVDAAAAGTDAARVDLIARVVRLYLRVLSNREVVAAEDRRIGALLGEERRVGRLLEQGEAAQVELLRTAAAISQARANRVALAAHLDVAEHDLARTLGVEAGAARAEHLVAVTLAHPPDSTVRGELLVRARAVNPLFQQARHNAAAAEARTREARSAWFPALQLEGRYATFGALDNTFTAEWQAGVRVSYPLFAGGERTSAIRAARASATQAREQVRVIELQVESELDRALAAVYESRARVEALGVALRHLEEVVRIERLALSQGAGVQTDYLSAEADLFLAQASLIQARHLQVEAHVELSHTVGDLSPTRLARIVEVQP